MSSKLAEAEKLMAAGKKHTSKGFFKKPDWDTGASDLQKAATIYQHLGEVEKCKEASTLAAEAHANAGNLYHAGTVLEACATFLKDKNREREAPALYIQAARYFAQADKAQNQADCLMKASRSVSVEQSDEAAKWMIEGIQALENSEKWHLVRDAYRALVLLQVRSNKLVEAIATEKQFQAAMAKADNADLAAKIGLEIVILCLALGEDGFVLADREFKEMTNSAFGFPHSTEQRIAYDMIDACEQRDPERLAEVVKDQRISFLINEISRLAKKLKVPGGPAPPRVGARGGAAAPAAADDEEDTR
jgi:hypothetical protein